MVSGARLECVLDRADSLLKVSGSGASGKSIWVSSSPGRDKSLMPESKSTCPCVVPMEVPNVAAQMMSRPAL